MDSFKSSIIIVTGCTGGIGSAVCRELNRKGAFIIGINKNEEKRSPWVSAQYSFDLGSVELTEKYIQMIYKQYGCPGYLIHCSGSLIPGKFHKLSNNEISSAVNSNLLSLFNIIRAVRPLMRKRQAGHIVVVGSLGGIVPMPYSALYASMKFAVRGFCLSLSEELKEDGIALSLVSPGPVDTPMLGIESSDEDAFVSFIQKPMKAEYLAHRIIKILLKPSLEKLLPSSSRGAVLISGLFPGIILRSIHLMKNSGRRGIELYRKNMSIKTAG